jgi:hypothetical protein
VLCFAKTERRRKVMSFTYDEDPRRGRRGMVKLPWGPWVPTWVPIGAVVLLLALLASVRESGQELKVKSSWDSMETWEQEMAPAVPDLLPKCPEGQAYTAEYGGYECHRYVSVWNEMYDWDCGPCMYYSDLACGPGCYPGQVCLDGRCQQPLFLSDEKDPCLESLTTSRAKKGPWILDNPLYGLILSSEGDGFLYDRGHLDPFVGWEDYQVPMGSFSFGGDFSGSAEDEVLRLLQAYYEGSGWSLPAIQQVEARALDFDVVQVIDYTWTDAGSTVDYRHWTGHGPDVIESPPVIFKGAHIFRFGGGVMGVGGGVPTIPSVHHLNYQGVLEERRKNPGFTGR